MFRITQREEVFFDLFVETMDSTCNTAEMLLDLMTNYFGVEDKIKAIEEKEHECDLRIHKILKHLNRSFITPIDREDIYLIAKELDNITDGIESTAHRFRMFNVKEVRPDAIVLAKLIIKCTIELKELLGELKHAKKNNKLSSKVIEINRIENEGDDIFRTAIAKLFVTEKDAIELVKWKEIYEYLENTLDVCEDVANIIEGVVMKNA